MLWLDGVFENVEQPQRKPRLHRARAPTSTQLTQLGGKIAHRVCRHLVRKGWLEGEDESAFLSDRAGCDDGLDALRMSSITYRIATGKHAGRKVATLQTIAANNGSTEGDAGKVGGFSLHAGVAAEAHEGQKLERLRRCIACPAISEKRLSLSPQGTALPAQGTVEERHDARGVRAGRVHRQTRGPSAAAARPPDPLLRRLCAEREVACAADAIGARQKSSCGRGVDCGQQRPPQPDEKRRLMTWAQSLKRVFNIDVSTCVYCGGSVRIVASIEEPKAIRAILDHFAKHGAMEPAHYRPAARAPPAVAA